MSSPSAPPGIPVVALEGVSRSYRTGPVTVEVLQEADLTLEAGDCAAVMGPSGSGKSTLLNLVGLLEPLASGSYRLMGQDVSSLGDDGLARLRNAAIGFVFQSFHLLDRLTACQNAGLPLVYRGVRRSEIRSRATEMLERVGLGDRVDHFPAQLSGGQRQRVAIARALVGEPALLLADEPTGALDPDSGSAVMDLLLELNVERGTTVLLITHDAKVARCCARRFRLEDGRLRERRLPGAVS